MAATRDSIGGETAGWRPGRLPGLDAVLFHLGSEGISAQSEFFGGAGLNVAVFLKDVENEGLLDAGENAVMEV